MNQPKLLMIAVLSILLSACIQKDYNDKSLCFSTFIKNTTNETVLVKSKYYAFGANEDTVLTVYKNSYIKIDVGEVGMVQDFVDPALIEIYSANDTTLIGTQQFSENGSLIGDQILKTSMAIKENIDSAVDILYVCQSFLEDQIGIEAERYQTENIEWYHYPIHIWGGAFGTGRFNNLENLDYVKDCFNNTAPGYSQIAFYEISIH